MTAKDMKVKCEICEKEPARSSLRMHKKKVHKVEVSKKVAPLEKKDNDKEESNFTKTTMDIIKNTEGHLLEAQEDAEMFVHVEEFEKVRDEMVPDSEWMRHPKSSKRLAKRGAAYFKNCFTALMALPSTHKSWNHKSSST